MFLKATFRLHSSVLPELLPNTELDSRVSMKLHGKKLLEPALVSLGLQVTPQHAIYFQYFLVWNILLSFLVEKFYVVPRFADSCIFRHTTRDWTISLFFLFFRFRQNFHHAVSPVDLNETIRAKIKDHRNYFWIV